MNRLLFRSALAVAGLVLTTAEAPAQSRGRAPAKPAASKPNPAPSRAPAPSRPAASTSRAPAAAPARSATQSRTAPAAASRGGSTTASRTSQTVRTPAAANRSNTVANKPASSRQTSARPAVAHSASHSHPASTARGNVSGANHQTSARPAVAHSASHSHPASAAHNNVSGASHQTSARPAVAHSASHSHPATTHVNRNVSTNTSQPHHQPERVSASSRPAAGTTTSRTAVRGATATAQSTASRLRSFGETTGQQGTPNQGTVGSTSQVFGYSSPKVSNAGMTQSTNASSAGIKGVQALIQSAPIQSVDPGPFLGSSNDQATREALDKLRDYVLTGESVGKGQCAELVEDFAKVGLVKDWQPGLKVRDRVVPFKPAATFVDGVYPNKPHGNHAAVVVATANEGLVVFDQYSGKLPGFRTLKFEGGMDPSTPDGRRNLASIAKGEELATAFGLTPDNPDKKFRDAFYRIKYIYYNPSNDADTYHYIVPGASK